MGTGEHVPFFTKLLHYYQARHALAQARKEAKRAQHDHAAHRSKTENDVGTDDTDNKDN